MPRPSLARNRRTILQSVPLVLASSLVLFFTGRTAEYQFDDALIYLRYVRNFSEGLGLVYNPGERFNGLTSPAYTFVLAAGSFFTRNLQAMTIAVSAAFFLAGVLASAWVFGRSWLERSWVALLLASSSYFYNTFGLESSMLILFSVLALGTALAQKWFCWGTVAAILILTRMEASLLVGLLFAHTRWRRGFLPPRRAWVSPIVLASAYLAFNLLYYGRALPDTITAKLGQARSGYWTSVLHGGYLVDWFLQGNALLALALFVLAGIGLAGSWRRPAVGLYTLYAILLFAILAFANTPNYHWYYAPQWHAAVVLAGLGSARLLRFDQLSGLRRAGARGVALLLVVPTLVLQIIHASEERTIGSPEYRAIGSWLGANLRPTERVAAVEVGFLGYYSRLPILDILGLTNPENAARVGRRDLRGWTEARPEYVVVHDPLWPLEEAAPDLVRSGDYVRDERLEAPGFVLLRRSDVTVRSP